MIDNLILLFTGIACAYVIYRAVLLDSTLSWFAPVRPTEDRVTGPAPEASANRGVLPPQASNDQTSRRRRGA